MLGKDLVYAARALAKSPVFLVTALVTIALGIGASTAIFSVTNAVLLRQLPYNDADRLVEIGGDLRRRNIYDERISFENYSDVRKGTAGVFDDMACVATFRNTIPRQDGTPEQVRTALVSSNFFHLLGAHIVAGRDFDDSDGQPASPPDPAANPNAAPPLPTMAIVSYEYWQRRFGGNPGALGRPMLNGAPNSPVIVGVLAPGFELEFRASSNVDRNPDLFMAMRNSYDNRNRNTYFLRGIGKVRAGVSLDRVEELAGLAAAEVRRDFPVYAGGGFYYHIEPLQHHLVAEVRPTILALTGAVMFLLLIACANVANLLLVRTSLRTARAGGSRRAGRKPLAADPADVGRSSAAGGRRNHSGHRAGLCGDP